MERRDTTSICFLIVVKSVHPRGKNSREKYHEGHEVDKVFTLEEEGIINIFPNPIRGRVLRLN